MLQGVADSVVVRRLMRALTEPHRIYIYIICIYRDSYIVVLTIETEWYASNEISTPRTAVHAHLNKYSCSPPPQETVEASRKHLQGDRDVDIQKPQRLPNREVQQNEACHAHFHQQPKDHTEEDHNRSDVHHAEDHKKIKRVEGREKSGRKPRARPST